MEFQNDISFRNITIAKFQCPKFKKGNNSKKYHMTIFNFSPNILFIIPYQLTVSRFNTVRDTAFTKFHPLLFRGPYFYKGR